MKNKKLEVKTDKRNYNVEMAESGLLLDNQLFDFDARELKKGIYSIISNNRVFEIEIVEADVQSKTFVMKVNGTAYTLTAQNELDILLKQLGMDMSKGMKVNKVLAPMPGLILDILVDVGGEVNEGESILVLEAMKMENVLKSPTNGVVKSVKVVKGDNVEKNQLLIEFE